jgi:1,4-alpha-glucan branching enzyme
VLKKKFFKTKDECEVAFEVLSAEAQVVALLCESNDWKPIDMKKGKDGAFRARLRVPKDRRFEFRYLVDSKSWLNDDAADAYVTNRFGTKNSVLDTTSTPTP